MSAAEAEEQAILRPRLTHGLFGHADAERTLLDAYRSGRIPHAWLIGGGPGLGKATLAYRLARFVLAHPDPSAAAVRSATSLAVDPDHPTARRIAGMAHSDLLVLRRIINEKTGKMFTEIRVDDIRRTVPFFGSTAGEGGWRIAIVDAFEELNTSGENALLKVLEEPPPRCLLLLVSNAPGQALPTIRSRCRSLALRPLEPADVARAGALALADDAPDATALAEAAQASQGSVGQAIKLLHGDTLELRRQIATALDQLPRLDLRALHALGDGIAGTRAEPLAAFADVVSDWLEAQLRTGSTATPRLARIGEAWTAVNEALRDAADYNLDRKPLVFSVFEQLAAAAKA